MAARSTFCPALVITLVLLGACGGREGASSAGPSRPDTLSLGPDLDSARKALDGGGAARCDSFARLALQRWTAGDPEVRRRVALGLVGVAFHQRGSEDSARTYLEQALALSLAAGDSDRVASNRQDLGLVHSALGDYPAAQELLLGTLRFREAAQDSSRIAGTLINLSAVHYLQNDLDQSMLELRRALAIDSALKDSLGITIGINNLAHQLIQSGRYQEAIDLLRPNIVLRHKLQPGRSKAALYANMARAFRGLGQWDSSLFHARRTAAEALRHGQRDKLALGLLCEARALHGTGRMREAAAKADSSLRIARALGRPEQMADAHEQLALSYRALREPELAYLHGDRERAIRDSLVNAERDEQMIAQRTRYEMERRESENGILRQQKAVAEAETRASRVSMVAVTATALVFVLVTLVLVQRYRQRTRARESELEQQVLRTQMDPHFLFNALGAVPGMYAAGEAGRANDHIAQLAGFLRLVLETSRRRVVPLAREIRLLEHYLRICANRRSGRLGWRIRVEPGLDAERLAIPPMILQPIVENAVEHGLRGRAQDEVVVEVRGTRDTIVVQVADNGIGREAAADRPNRAGGSSMGLELVRERVRLFNGPGSRADALQVDDHRAPDGTATGTTVVLRLRRKRIDEHTATGLGG